MSVIQFAQKPPPEESKQSKQPSLVEEEEWIAAEVYALIRGRDARAVAAALHDVLGNLCINMLPPNTRVQY